MEAKIRRTHARKLHALQQLPHVGGKTVGLILRGQQGAKRSCQRRIASTKCLGVDLLAGVDPLLVLEIGQVDARGSAATGDARAVARRLQTRAVTLRVRSRTGSW